LSISGINFNNKSKRKFIEIKGFKNLEKNNKRKLKFKNENFMRGQKIKTGHAGVGKSEYSHSSNGFILI